MSIIDTKSPSPVHCLLDVGSEQAGKTTASGSGLGDFEGYCLFSLREVLYGPKGGKTSQGRCHVNKDW